MSIQSLLSRSSSFLFQLSVLAEIIVLVSLSIITSFGCLVKFLFFSWKCLHASLFLGWEIFMSFLWLLSLVLKEASACCVHNVRSIKDMIYGLEQLISWKTLYLFRVCWKLMLFWLDCSTNLCYFKNSRNIFLISKRFCSCSFQCWLRISYCQWILWGFSQVRKLQTVCFEILFQGFVNW